MERFSISLLALRPGSSSYSSMSRGELRDVERGSARSTNYNTNCILHGKMPPQASHRWLFALTLVHHRHFVMIHDPRVSICGDTGVVTKFPHKRTFVNFSFCKVERSLQSMARCAEEFSRFDFTWLFLQTCFQRIQLAWNSPPRISQQSGEILSAETNENACFKRCI